MTAHIESKKEEIAKIVIMPGDPLRAKMIAESYLENVKEVNSVRNMIAYTGEFQGTRITVFPSGMGIPSIGIYAYELYKFYGVERIIRVGSCGSLHPKARVRDIVLSKSATASSNFAKLLTGDERKCFESSKNLNEIIENTAKEEQIPLLFGDTVTSDVFDVYVDDYDRFIQNFEKKDYLASEMEAYALFFLADLFKKEAACLLTVVDSKYEPDVMISPDERQNSLNDMIHLALLSSIK